jgi:anti-anti-sigma factor
MGSPGVVRVRTSGGALDVQVEGWGTMLHSQAIRQWVEANLGQAALVRVDLSRCTHMDSTFIGTLLGLKRVCDSRPACGLVLVCPSAHCRQVLSQMRIGHIFQIEPEPFAAGEWQEVCVQPEAIKSRAFQNNVVEAHQRLADCEGPTGERFRQLAADMQRELDQK